VFPGSWFESPQRDPAAALRAAFPYPGALSFVLSLVRSFECTAKRSIDSSRPLDIFDI
jgi:hypothetical protein